MSARRTLPVEIHDLIRQTVVKRLDTLSDKMLSRQTGLNLGTLRKILLAERHSIMSVRGVVLTEDVAI